MKRVIVFLLALTMVFSAITLASCSEKQQDKGNNNQSQDDDRIWLDNLPDDIDLEGETITFVGHGVALAERFGLEGTFVDEDDGDSVNGAMYASEENVKNRFNVEIEKITTSNTLADSISSQLMAGDSDYDILAGHAHADFGMAANGYLLNINTLDSLGAGGIIDYSRSYWAKDFIDAASYKNFTYWLLGDISIETLGCMYVTFVNDSLYQRTCQERYGSIYDIVTAGEWTIDTLCEMTSLCYTDNNGNDSYDDEDTYGWATHWIHVVDGISMGLGLEYSQHLADGTVALTLATNPRNVDVLLKMNELKALSTSHTYAQEIATINAFKEDRVMFMVNSLRHTELNLREMQNDYYILPVPKLNTAQESYRTALHDQVTIFGISYASTKVYASAVVLEALCAEHSRLVRPAYYDEALKYKYTRDDASADMIDIVRDSVCTDFACSWSSDLGEITHEIRRMSTNPSSDFRKRESTWTSKLNALTAKLETTYTE